jgi:3-phenylpropionate/cinnamic acid dioxygenase small subunit
METENGSAHEQIRTVLYRYCRGVDRNDWGLLRACYHPGAVDEHGRYNGEIDGFVAWLQAELPRYESTMHLVGNALIEIDGDHAHVESYCVAYHRLRPDDEGRVFDRTVWVRYLDEFARIDGAWRINHRRCVYEFIRTDPVSEASVLGPAYRRGTRDREDASYMPGR